MSQENFDDLLRQSFDEERDIPFDESAWQALSGQLPAKKKRYALPLWVLLLLGSGWLVATYSILRSTNTYQATHNDIYEVARETVANTPSTAKDTICVEQIVVVKDTIIEYRYLNNQHSNKVASLPKLSKVNQLDIVKSSTPVDENKYATSYIKIPRLADKIDALPIPARAEYLLAVSHLQQNNKSKRKRLELGVEVGTHLGDINLGNNGLLNGIVLPSQDENASPDAVYSTVESNAAGESYNFTPVSLYQYGIKANYEVLNNLFIQVGGGQESISYENYNSAPFDRAGALNALRSYAGTNQLLTQKSMYYELGLQKRFGKRRIQPIAHIGLRMRSHLNRIVQANTFSDQPSYLYNFSYNSTRLKEDNSLRVEQIRMGLGANLQFAKQWSLQASIDSYSSLRNDTWIRANWGINVGLHYKL